MKGKGLEVQDKNTGTSDAHQRLLSGELNILSNVFHNIGSFTTIDGTSTGIIRVTSGQPMQDDADASDLTAHLINNGTAVANPGIQSISRAQDEMLDPRPTAGMAAFEGTLAAYPDGDLFFDNVDYRGAFAAEEAAFWLAGWSALARNNHIGLVTGVREVASKELLGGFRIYPNPATDYQGFTIETVFEEAGFVVIYTMDGREVERININGGGLTQATTRQLAKGTYALKFVTESGLFATRTLIVQ
jgi:hypothetical protein